MRYLRIDPNGPKPEKPVGKRKKARARNPKAVFEDPVFKASEVKFYPPGYDTARSVVQVRKENGRLLREGCIESVRYLTADGRDLVEFTCSPASNSASAVLFRILVESGCVEKLKQKRTIERENPV